jgi:hypothetical protein
MPQSARRQFALLALPALSSLLLLALVLWNVADPLYGLRLGLALTGIAPASPLPTTAGGCPSALPTHFGFGVISAPGDADYLGEMRAKNGTAWDFRYQYLSAGANTGQGWATWDSPAGAFATSYIQDSAAHRMTPVFVYYMLLQSNGPSGDGEAGTDLAHLADPATMQAYYADWTLLMQRIGASRTATLVIVEPDLWGYIEQAASEKGSVSAAGVAASVASSGNADAAGLPDTAQGFAWALLRIRDRYAPHATLALHASPWGTRQDAAGSTDPQLDAARLGAREADFLDTLGLANTPPGISPFDLLSTDIADHDSGQSGVWWDPANRALPNFARYLQFASALTSGTQRCMLLWQVPEGNQYFDTEDNTAGHTQDNKAAYILGHVGAFARAGIAGVLFGPGNGGTELYDRKGDGITNPAPVSGFGCDRCNTHRSSYPDDDGGYLRIFVGQYYNGGAYPLANAAIPASGDSGDSGGNGAGAASGGGCVPRIDFGAATMAPSSVTAGSSVGIAVRFTARCASASGLIDIEVYGPSGERAWQDFEDAQPLTGKQQTFSAAWAVPRTAPSGDYTLKVGIFSAGWGTLYGWEDTAATLHVSSTYCAPQISFGTAGASPTRVAPGKRVTLSATLTASCRAQALIDFEIYDGSGQKVFQTSVDDQALTGKAQTFTAAWDVPTGQASGTYTLKLGVFAAGWGALYNWDDDAAHLSIG